VPRLLIGAAALLVVAPAPAFLTVAHAAATQSVTVPVSQASWFWRGQVGVIGSTGIAAPVAVADPTVPGGDLAVSGPELPAAAGSPAGPLAETYLAFDVSEIPVGSTITSFKVVLPVDSRGVTVDEAGASIIACAPKSSWAGGLFASAYSGKPADGCNAHSPRLRKGSGHTYGVDIASIAQRWVEPDALNLGIAITDNPGNSLTAYQVVFGPGAALSKLTASVTYRVPGTGEVGPIVASSSGSGGAAAPSADGGSPMPGLVSVVPVGPLPTGLPPDVAGESDPSTQAVAPIVVADVRPAGSSAPPLGFWFALMLIVLLLGTTTFILSDPDVPLGLIGDRGVTRALRARRFAPRAPQEPT
jgi:hypothetical protein